MIAGFPLILSERSELLEIDNCGNFLILPTKIEWIATVLLQFLWLKIFFKKFSIKTITVIFNNYNGCQENCKEATAVCIIREINHRNRYPYALKNVVRFHGKK